MKFRSGLEERLSNYLDKENVPYLYEVNKYEYTLTSSYTPDFFLPNGVIIEAKGFLKPPDSRKMIAVKKQHPELDIRFVFMSDNTLTRNSKTTYPDWATKKGHPACIYPHHPDSRPQ